MPIAHLHPLKRLGLALALTLSAINHQYKAGIHVVPRVLKVRADN